MAWHDGVETGIAWPVAAGAFTLALIFGGFGSWAALAPLQGAVVAPATVMTDGHNKIVQHLEGGVVREILVTEGQRVREGEPLLVLDGTASRSQVSRIKLQLAALQALEARALAERDGAKTIAFPAALTAERAPEIVSLIGDQSAEFATRLQKHQIELAVLERQIGALDAARAGHETQKTETRHQIELVVEERQSAEGLLLKGLTRKSQVLALRRAEAELTGKEAQLAAAIAQGRQSVAEIRERSSQLKTGRVEDASARLSEIRPRQSELIEQLRTAEDISGRVVVRAPAAGTVMTLSKYNPGAVIAPGQELMKIVPDGTGLIVEARIRPQDIAEVKIGQKARLTFPALDARTTPPVPAEVVYISADRLQEERSGEVYYLARLKVLPDPIAGFDPARVGPGHAADVFITTGERSFLAYVTAPFMKSLNRSLRES
ncbi:MULTISPECIES: HlyD family type I secretion periplasmic adaptor subunit [Rhodomicrobium]|uniref:HlyD family type I secretion periplasmic adaptor subunit n=1 Tax=Rhodomicrobium TaxID=1068 RepID=UPI000B4BF538|nr:MULTISPECIES: HlyD family type I secretion periplasmic adaptor subunit [Rhodomicrobium]